VTYVETDAFCYFFCLREGLTTFERRQCGQRSRIEPRASETKTSVHRVGRQFQSLLLDVILWRSRYGQDPSSQSANTKSPTCIILTWEVEVSFIRLLTVFRRPTRVAIKRGKTP
jgi:hypothetical protein